MVLRKLLDWLRLPQYTGENRCIPCTLLNSLIALFIAASLAFALLGLGFESNIAFGVAGATLLLESVTIGVRGYLIPGTPKLTKSYFPEWLLLRFDKHPEMGAKASSDDIEPVLKQAGIVTECEEEDDLCLTDWFRESWWEKMAANRETEQSRTELAGLLSVDPVRLSIETHGEAFVAHVGDRRVGQWESRAAFIADMAAANVLSNQVPDWASIDLHRRSQILNALRIFLDRCPICEGSLTTEDDQVESCCRSIEIIATSCDQCNARVFEAEYPSETN